MVWDGVYNLKCKKCGVAFTGRLPSIRYCDKCRTRVCENCGKVWKLQGAITKHEYKFCGVNCANHATMTKNWANESFRKKMSENGKRAGAHLTKINGVGSTHPKWKGDNVGKSGVHSWVKKHLGTASSKKFCEHCKQEVAFQHWSNISNEYKRDLTDWQHLCVKCHSKFDRNR